MTWKERAECLFGAIEFGLASFGLYVLVSIALLTAANNTNQSIKEESNAKKTISVSR